MKLVKGLYTAVVTPFHEDGSLDLEGFQKLLLRQLEAGVQGITVLGSTGEAPTLSLPEKRALLGIAKATIQDKCHFMVGSGSYCTRSCIEATELAAAYGADSALVVTPYYNRPPQEGLVRHFMEVADHAAIPLVLYHVPARTGCWMTVETYQTLAAHPNIIGTKEATGDLVLTSAILEATRKINPDFFVFSGDDNLVLPFISLGADGLISVASNLLPEQMHDLCSFALNEQWVEARALFYELFPLFKALNSATNPIPIKAALELSNLAGGPVRSPLTPLTETHLNHLKHVLSKQWAHPW